MPHPRRYLILVMALFLVLATGALTVAAQGELPDGGPTPIEQLGEALYFDEALAINGKQSCASCHDPAFGFGEPGAHLPVSEGTLPHKVGTRNSPSVAYAMYAPILYFDDEEGLWIGGQFWDGRATGWVYGDPLADQAAGPFLNPVEMANPNKQTVINSVRRADYADLFEQVWGPGSLRSTETAYDQVALSIAAFERTQQCASFTSKYDAYLQACLALGGDLAGCAIGQGQPALEAGQAVFSPAEWQGLQLFVGENDNDGVLAEGEGAMCSACHLAEWTPADAYGLPVQSPAWAPAGMVPPLFTDFTYDNLGVPRNTAFPFTGAEPVDLGLGPVVDDEEENGKFKVVTLRNIGLTAPYAHNGYFTTLEEITHFYSARDVDPAIEPAEYPDTVNHDELGSLGLSPADEAALVAFMLTLSDGYTP